ncbi:MAG: 1-deoxy-D-xylulose-5-phosphate reductoisomerase [Betaproteobacteria bacterium]|nr:1-deoxy-D-xylulose-5-phosphate reductoisomerase [Betaproteobacteria bacterium]
MILRNLTVLGSTGSIGVSTLDVVARHPERFRVKALTAQNRVERLLEQCLAFQPEYAVMLDRASAERLQSEISARRLPIRVLSGQDGLEFVASLPGIDTVVAAIVGAAGLRPTLAAARSGKRVLLANKETLVMAGRLFMDTVREHGATLLPIDSEHNAIFQALPPAYSGDLAQAGVRRILLTASGGPFRNTPLDALDQVTPEQACAHPNWVMGRKISVDSATMMNKGLEVIEAHWLFGAAAEQIQVVIHPQSVIHSMVEYVDGSVIAQLGNPDMRTPIAYALSFPERIEAGVSPVDLFRIATLNFDSPDLVRFPCLSLAYQALKAGGTGPAILNAANEVAVDSFLARELPFTAIPRLIEHVLGTVGTEPVRSLDDVLQADRNARAAALEWRALSGKASRASVTARK